MQQSLLGHKTCLDSEAGIALIHLSHLMSMLYCAFADGEDMVSKRASSGLFFFLRFFPLSQIIFIHSFIRPIVIRSLCQALTIEQQIRQIQSLTS